MEFLFLFKCFVVVVVVVFFFMVSVVDILLIVIVCKGFVGYDYLNQYLVKLVIIIVDNMMLVMQYLVQDKEIQQKLVEFEKKIGKKLNVVVFLLDDVGWMDVGFNGGGVVVGNFILDIDVVVSQGLILILVYF